MFIVLQSMESKMKVVYLLIFIFLNLNCLSSPYIFLFGKSEHHISAKNPNTITSNRILKRGESCSYSSYIGNLFMLYYGVGGSINQAMEKAGITKVAVVDQSSLNIFPLYYEECIIVYGE